LKPPSTFSQLLDICQKISAAGKTPIAYIQGLATFVPLAADSFVYAADPKWTTERNAHKTTFVNTLGWRHVFEDWVALKNAKCFPPDAPAGTSGAAYAKIASGQAAMLVASANQMPSILAINPNAHLNMFPFPGDKPSQLGATFSPLGALGIPKDASNRDAARAFVDFIERPAQSSLFNRLSGTLSMSDFAKGEFPSNWTGMVAAAKKRSAILELNFWPTGAAGKYISVSEGLISGQLTVDQALQQMDTAWDQR
jgi:raffinose/stachyose/melibiose transport system substrate-binding protein